MTKKFYIWKDKNCKGISPDWLELSAKEFIQFCKKNKSSDPSDRRYFYRVPNIEIDDCYLFIECTYENYKKSQVEKNRKARKEKRRKEFSKFETVSFDMLMENCEGDESTLYDIVPGDYVCVEDGYIKSEELCRLREIVDKLPEDEKELINALFFDNPECLSERAAADILNIPRQTLHSRKKKIFEKIKKSFSQN